MLVITIVILGILASAVILSIKNTSVIDETESVVFKSDMTTYNDIYDMYVVKKTMQDITFDETNLNLTYKDAEFENIFGKVPDKYKDGLKVIKGKLVYITTDKKESEIIQDMGMIPNKMKITNRLVHCTMSNTATSVAYEKGYESTLKVDTDYTLQKVTVVMGGVDITSSAYSSSGNTITINSVTGDIVIMANATPITYNIKKNLSNATLVNTNTTVAHGGQYITKILVDEGYAIQTVTVIMGSVDITDTAYDSTTCTVTVAEVTDNLTITVTTTVAQMYNVTYDLYGVTSSNNVKQIASGASFSTTLCGAGENVMGYVQMGSDVIERWSGGAMCVDVIIPWISGDLMMLAYTEWALPDAD